VFNKEQEWYYFKPCPDCTEPDVPEPPKERACAGCGLPGKIKRTITLYLCVQCADKQIDLGTSDVTDWMLEQVLEEMQASRHPPPAPPTTEQRAACSPDEILNQCIYVLESIAPDCEHTVAAREAYRAWLAEGAQDGGGE
jgi:hypothetical protein